MRWTASKISLSLGGHRRAQARVRGCGEGGWTAFTGRIGWGHELHDKDSVYGELIRSLLMGQGNAQEAKTLEVVYD